MNFVRNATQKWAQIRTQITNNVINLQYNREETDMTTNCNRTQCEVFSRSMGFIRPVKNFNIGKFSEFSERKTFTEANCLSAGQRHCELLKRAA
ncbi:MAG: hypothetical protein IKL37_00835 [Alphaproteobacteria bacterium]|nr:hypothetical protein [Alphaproteobacteria bacterium]MBR6684793.1 hypothetical protein [Alphaproteobacteria bacterium]